MNREEMSNIAKRTLDYVLQFFGSLKEEEKHHLPAILKSPGRWMANYQGLAVGIFFLNEAALKRVSAYQNKGREKGHILNIKYSKSTFNI